MRSTSEPGDTKVDGRPEHERGLYEEKLTLAGLVEVTVVFRTGETVMRLFLKRELWDDHTIATLTEWLNIKDPERPRLTLHGGREAS